MRRCPVLVFIYAIIITGCINKTGTGTPGAGQTYYFYPKANVYYDTTADNYVFLSPDGNWQTESKLPAEKQVLLEKNIVINNPEIPVWKNNDAHQLLYSATLYSTAADFKEEVKIAAKKAEPESDKKVEKEKESKTDLGKFFEKIFKGKKEREEKEVQRTDTTKS